MPPVGLLPHQQVAIADLQRFGAGPARAGLVVAPTGSGKSRLLATWLTSRVTQHGDRVLWVAHRRSLLSQASAELASATGGAAPMVTARQLATTRAPVVVASVASLRTMPGAIARWARRGPAWLVLDEAHHAPARSFRKLIERARAAGVRVVGATATPTRTAPAERAVLSALFDGNVITRIAVQPLVERSVLARATLVRVATETVADGDATEIELRRLARTGDLSPSWLRRLAEVAPRNEIVVSHLARHRSRYGPTIIFAHDVLHAALLARRLRARRFRVDYATGERPDGTTASITDVIARFNAAELDVIIGVDALDEGVDLVRARTVILMRPTRSEIRLRQCIGRVLRGPALGGDPIAFVVVAEDHWQRVAGFHSALELVRDAFAAPMADEAPQHVPRGVPTQTPDFAMLASASDGLGSASDGAHAEVTESAPVARIITVDENRATTVVPVSAVQLAPWRGLLSELSTLSRRALSRVEPEMLSAKHFSWMDDVPAPTAADVSAVLAHARLHHAPPALEPIASYESPHALALRIRAADLGEAARSALLRSVYAGTARHLYGSIEELRQSVDAVLTKLMAAAASDANTSSNTGSTGLVRGSENAARWAR